MALPANISIYHGDTYEETWTLKQADGVTPYNLSGAKVWMTVKTAYSVADPGSLQISSPASGIVFTDIPNGVINMTITAAQSAALAVQTYVYDIQIKDVAGKIFTLTSGTFTVNPEVTITTT